MVAMSMTLPRFFYRHCVKYKLAFLGLISASLFWAFNLSLSPYLLKLLIDQATLAETKQQELFQALWISASLYVLFTFLTSLVLRFYDWIFLWMFPKMKSEITLEAFSRLERHPYPFFQQNFAGSLGNKINDLAKGTTAIIYYFVDQILARFFSFGIGTCAMYMVHPFFAGLLLTWSFAFLLTSILLLKRSQVYSENYSKANSAVVGKIVDSISNIFIVKSYARETHEKVHLESSLDASIDKERGLLRFLMKMKIFYTFSITFLSAGTIWLLIEKKAQNQITVGDFALILTLTTVLMRDIFLLTSQLVGFSEQIGACKQALSLVYPQVATDVPVNSPLQVKEGKIVFDRVSFGYEKGQRLFANKSVTIEAGSKVGIVGLSGSGKTTFVNLILRFFELNGGKIEIDGKNIQNVSPESLRSQIALIPQEPHLFHRSLKENIRYGRLEASDVEVIESAKKAHAHEFIEKLSEGYESLVGERGVKLSGGQRQRIAIARAVLKNAPILILDEATSSLDSTTEKQIQESLSLLMQGRTTLVIAHRLSTLSQMDRILVLDAGMIVEDGTHTELLALNGHYKRLWDIQSVKIARFSESC